ncbi:MAG: hypothetical protein ACREA2_05530 [Blastocatellia bacterium]
MAETTHLNGVRGAALNRIEKSERNFKLGMIIFAILESLFLLLFILLMDRSNKLHVLLFVASVGFYTLIILGLVVLGLHVRRDTQLVLRAIETLSDHLAANRR